MNQQLSMISRKLSKSLAPKSTPTPSRFEANATKIDANAARIDANTDRLDRLTVEVLTNHELIEQRATREELNQRFDELVTGIDEIMAILTRWDQERVIANARLDRVETDVARNKSDIKEIKRKLAMP